MEFGMSRRVKPKEKYVRISNEGNFGAFWTVRRKKELWSYVVSFEFSRPKGSSDRT